MRVLLVHNFYRIAGGEDSIVREELSLLKNSSVDVELYSVSNDDIGGALHTIATALQVIYNPWARRALAKKIAEFGPDVVHIHNFFPRLSPPFWTLAGMPACRPCSPCITTGSFVPRRSSIPRKSSENGASATPPGGPFRKRFTAIPELERSPQRDGRVPQMGFNLDAQGRPLHNPDELRQAKFTLGGLPEEKIVVKPNCTARPPVFDNLPREGALFVGRLDMQKGIPILLEAWKTIDYPLNHRRRSAFGTRRAERQRSDPLSRAPAARGGSEGDAIGEVPGAAFVGI